MADLQNLAEVSHWWGNDLTVTDTGDLEVATKTDRSRQRVLRRLMTIPGDYLAHPDYGGGLPAYIGQNAEAAKIKTKISGQMKLESAVSQDASDAPSVSLSSSAGTNMLSASISFVASPAQDPAVLSFSIDE